MAPEINSEMQLDEALVKSLTACDMMSTRGMYEGMSEFRPELTIFQHTNHMPVIKGNGLGIWRRMVVIPFEVSIPSDKQNPKLPDTLKFEAEGILAWLVEGFRKYQQEGLRFPEAVNRKLGKYRKAMDPIGSFLEERVVVKANAGMGASALHKAYEGWCRETEVQVEDVKAFKASLEHRGYEQKKGRSGNLWVGVELVVEDDSDVGIVCLDAMRRDTRTPLMVTSTTEQVCG